MTSMLKDEIVRHSPEKRKPLEDRVHPHQNFSAASHVQQAGRSEVPEHCTAVTTCLAAFPGRNLPTRQGPHWAAFHGLGLPGAWSDIRPFLFKRATLVPPQQFPDLWLAGQWPFSSLPHTTLHICTPWAGWGGVYTSLCTIWVPCWFVFWSYLNFCGLVINDEWTKQKM